VNKELLFGFDVFLNYNKKKFITHKRTKKVIIIESSSRRLNPLRLKSGGQKKR